MKGSGLPLRDIQGITVDAENERVFIVESKGGSKALVSISMASGDRVIVSQ